MAAAGLNKRTIVVLGIALCTLVLGAVDASVARTAGGNLATGPRLPVIVHRGTTLPPPAQSKPVPLVIALHESGGNPQEFEQSTGLDAAADKHGFVVAYLADLAPASPAWTLVNMPANLAYVSSEITQLTAQQNIDPKRVYVTGFSAGATMTFFVGCQLSSQVDGIAVASGAMRFSDPCKLAHPVSELLFIGTNDAIPLNGSAVLLSAAQVAARWRGLDSCTAQSSSSTAGPVTQTVWNSCDDSAGVELDVTAGGTHQWPANGAERVWAFFAAHPGMSATAPSAALSSVAVHRSRAKLSVQAAFSVGEAQVALRVTVKRGGHTVTSKAFTLARSTHQAVVLQLPAKAAGGRYSLSLALMDSYGRRLTAVRSVTVPSRPKS